MKTAVVGILFVIIVAVSSEDCSIDADCMTTTCVDSNNIVRCSDGKCTCVDDVACSAEEDLGRCQSRYTCVNRFNAGTISCTCNNSNDIHCIDGQCHCGYPSNPSK